MSVFKCKMCGGTIEFEPGATVGICDSCGTKQTLPRLDDDRRANLYDRANHFRRNNEFDKAAGLYEQILNEDTTDAEAYWSLVLCKYGVEYVEDPATHKRVPTVNRAQYTSIYDDDNYKAALQYADGYQRSLYEEEASAINEIQKGILSIAQNEKPFDVFICYKETDSSGRRTPDSVLANDLYHQLVQEGFKVFFSRITLEDKIGIAYEPYIFAALNSAKVMVVIGTKPEYFKSPWVKNEWSRYLSIVKASNGKKMLIPAYRDMDPYDLPEEFSHLQAQDMSKLGFMQDLIRGIKKIVQDDSSASKQKETVIVGGGNANYEPLIKRAFMFLEDGDWEKADKFCEQALNIYPESDQAYLCKLMAEFKVHNQDELKHCDLPFDESDNYRKVIRFGKNELVSELEDINVQIKERNELARLEKQYGDALKLMEEASSEKQYLLAAETFQQIGEFRDSSELANKCNLLAEECREEENRKALEKKAKQDIFRKKVIVVGAALLIIIIAVSVVGKIPKYPCNIKPNDSYETALEKAKSHSEEAKGNGEKIKAENVTFLGVEGCDVSLTFINSKIWVVEVDCWHPESFEHVHNKWKRKLTLMYGSPKHDGDDLEWDKGDGFIDLHESSNGVHIGYYDYSTMK